MRACHRLLVGGHAPQGGTDPGLALPPNYRKPSAEHRRAVLPGSRTVRGAAHAKKPTRVTPRAATPPTHPPTGPSRVSTGSKGGASAPSPDVGTPSFLLNCGRIHKPYNLPLYPSLSAQLRGTKHIHCCARTPADHRQNSSTSQTETLFPVNTNSPPPPPSAHATLSVLSCLVLFAWTFFWKTAWAVESRGWGVKSVLWAHRSVDPLGLDIM